MFETKHSWVCQHCGTRLSETNSHEVCDPIYADGPGTPDFKRIFAQKQMAEFWKFCNSALEKYHKQEETELTQVVPLSVHNFMGYFISRLHKLLKAL